jgi:hypothetical protein
MLSSAATVLTELQIYGLMQARAGALARTLQMGHSHVPNEKLLQKYPTLTPVPQTLN